MTVIRLSLFVSLIMKPPLGTRFKLLPLSEHVFAAMNSPSAD
jgi:hypothetical protein